MKNILANFMKTGLTLVTGWFGAAVLLLTLTMLTQSAFADSTVLDCKVNTKYTTNHNDQL
jgi:hypothetical protein